MTDKKYLIMRNIAFQPFTLSFTRALLLRSPSSHLLVEWITILTIFDFLVKSLIQSRSLS